MEEDRRYCVYLITNVVNGKQYCGQTLQGAAQRWLKHQSESRGGSNRYFCRAVAKYGADSFSVQVLRDGLTKEEANLLEIRTIKDFRLTDNRHGYNLTFGGEGVIPNEETRRKMIENNAKRRRDVSDEEVVRLYLEGKSTVRISKILGITEPAINRRLRLNGVKIRPIGAKEPQRKNVSNEEIKRLYSEEGWTLQQIGNHFGMHNSSIWNRLDTMGVWRRSGGKRAN